MRFQGDIVEHLSFSGSLTSEAKFNTHRFQILRPLQHQNYMGCINQDSLLGKEETQQNFNLRRSTATRPYCQNETTTRAHGRT